MVTRLPNPRAVRGPARAPGGRDLHHPGPDAIREIHRIKRELRRAIWLMCEAPPSGCTGSRTSASPKSPETISANPGLRLGSQYDATYEMIDWTQKVL